MKKVLAVLLSLVCIFSMFAFSASAAIDELMTDVWPEEEPSYMLKYEEDTLDGVKMMYRPDPKMVFDGPGYATVTNDTPLAIDHNFVCWRDSKGNLYYEGDRIYVNDEITLYAVWESKTDNDAYTVRVIKTAILTLQRMVLKMLGIFQIVNDFEAEYYATTTEAETTAAAA